MSKLTVSSVVDLFKEQFPLAEVSFANETLQPWLFGCHIKYTGKNLILTPTSEDSPEGMYILECNNEGSAISTISRSYDKDSTLRQVKLWYAENTPNATRSDRMFRHSTSATAILNGLNILGPMHMSNTDYKIYSPAFGDCPIEIRVYMDGNKPGISWYITSYPALGVKAKHSDINVSLGYLYGLILDILEVNH